MTGMEHTEAAIDASTGPADRPDDPLANPIRSPSRLPVKQATVPPDATKKPKAPTPDQEGCYFLG